MRVHVTVEDGQNFYDDLDTLIANDEVLADCQDDIRAALGAGATYHGGGGAAPEFTISPIHRRGLRVWYFSGIGPICGGHGFPLPEGWYWSDTVGSIIGPMRTEFEAREEALAYATRCHAIARAIPDGSKLLSRAEVARLANVAVE